MNARRTCGQQVMNLELIIDWQQRGINARILGLSIEENPLLKCRPDRNDPGLEDWHQKVDAWLFGWQIEDTMRASNRSPASSSH